MLGLFEVLKWVFFFVSIIMWIFFLRWNYIFSDERFIIITKILMPGYLLLTGLVLWSLIASFIVIKNDYKEKFDIQKSMVKWYIIWVWIWIILSWIYIFYA